jgi:hypothetical protein
VNLNQEYMLLMIVIKMPTISEIILLKNQGYTQQQVADVYNTTKYNIQNQLRQSGISWGRIGYRKSKNRLLNES